MANPYFQFKHFTVWHDRCAMKVGTDAVLLGSWMHVDGARRLLDIGCGCGLIALMAAQRCDGQVVGVEIDSEAASQAAENVARSPWADRIFVVNEDVCKFSDTELFDVIFSNPPYFVDSLKCPDKKRNKARHTDSLDFEALMAQVSRLLAPDGEFSVVVPMQAIALLRASALSNRLYLSRETHVYTKEGASPKRALLAFKHVQSEVPVQPSSLCLQTTQGLMSDEYVLIVNDFYL